MKITILTILFLSLGQIYGQSNCNQFGENYIPKDLNDALNYLNCKWSETDKEEFKNKEESKAVSELHFGTGMSIRNGWNLWERKNKISKFFKSKGIYHPDDMSSIILTSFHRKLNNKDIDLESQIELYKNFWNQARLRNQEIEKKQKVKNEMEFNTYQIGDTVKVAFKFHKNGKNAWIYPIQKNPDLNEKPNCFIRGIVKEKKVKTRKSGNFVLTIFVIDICGNEEAIYSGLNEPFRIGKEYDFFRIESFKISKK